MLSEYEKIIAQKLNFSLSDHIFYLCAGAVFCAEIKVEHSTDKSKHFIIVVEEEQVPMQMGAAGFG